MKEVYELKNINGVGMFFILLVSSSIFTFIVSLLIQKFINIDVGIKGMAIINTMLIISVLFSYERRSSNKIKEL